MADSMFFEPGLDPALPGDPECGRMHLWRRAGEDAKFFSGFDVDSENLSDAVSSTT